MTYDLSAKFDSANSFYGKAVVEDDLNGSATLYSYKHKVAQIVENIMGDFNVYIFIVRDDYGKELTFSKTTLRHIKEFLKQGGLVAESKAQIIKDYEIVEV